jgi:myo-inositol catabolism protein IolC
MTPRGYTKPLYILPFDHRGSFQSGLFGWKDELKPEQTAKIENFKQVIYDGFKEAIAGGVAKEKAGILVDEQFGTSILHAAASDGFTFACPAEKSGQDEFDFQYGDDFSKHIEAIHPTFCKVLVRYNPEGDAAINKQQAERLKRLSDYLQGAQRSLFMFELLVPAEKSQLAKLNGDKKAYDHEMRPGLMLRTIAELQQAGVEPDVWKIEGLDKREDCEAIVKTARAGGRDNVGCIILGRGEDEQQVRSWLTTAASVPGFIGFAVGRTDFWDPLVALRDGKSTREEAVTAIAKHYRNFVDLFEAGAKGR